METRKADTRKQKRMQLKAIRNRRLLGRDLCACGSSMRCDGVCRNTHLNSVNVVVCPSVYRLEPPKKIERKGKRKPFLKKSPEKNEKEVNRQRFFEKRTHRKGD